MQWNWTWSWEISVGDVLVFVGLVVTAGTIWLDRRFRTLEFAASQFNEPELVDIRGYLDQWDRDETSPAEVARQLRNDLDMARDAQRFLQAGDRVAIGCRGWFLSSALVLRGWRREWLQRRYALLSDFLRGRTIERRGTQWPYPSLRRLCGWKARVDLDSPFETRTWIQAAVSKMRWKR